MFGKLTITDIPNDPLILSVVAGMVLGAVVIVAARTYFKKWGYLWTEWLTSVGHKKMGIMYIIFSLVMLLRGFADGIMMRTQQAMAIGASEGFMDAHHFDQIFSAHGTIMIIFVAMPFMFGLMNIVIPQQIDRKSVV